MGTTLSKFDDTRWEAADGGLTGVSQTLDGAEPVAKYSNFYLSKLMKAGGGRRDYAVRDSRGSVLYTTRKVRGTDVWFDLLEGDDVPRGRQPPILRVKAHSHHRKDWDVYAFDRPAFAGQTAEEEASKRVSDQEGGRPSSLYRKARFAISFASCEGSLALYERGPSDSAGVPSSAPILGVQEVKSSDPAFQTFLPSSGSNDERKTDGGLVGFWEWEDTPAEELRMKMHLARGTDLALHVIIAIVSDMVWHEKQGVAASAGAGVY